MTRRGRGLGRVGNTGETRRRGFFVKGLHLDVQLVPTVSPLAIGVHFEGEIHVGSRRWRVDHDYVSFLVLSRARMKAIQFQVKRLVPIKKQY